MRVGVLDGVRSVAGVGLVAGGESVAGGRPLVELGLGGGLADGGEIVTVGGAGSVVNFGSVVPGGGSLGTHSGCSGQVLLLVNHISRHLGTEEIGSTQ